MPVSQAVDLSVTLSVLNEHPNLEALLRGSHAFSGRFLAGARCCSSAAVRTTKLAGITGDIAFDAKGDRQKAQYFVLQVASEDPQKWGDNKIVKQLTIAAPGDKKS